MSTMTGQCMCGNVKYEFTGSMYGVISCHCKDCQRLHGNYNPMVVVEKDDVTFPIDSGLAWYGSSEDNERGFCATCGAALFHRPISGTRLLISVGSLDDTDGLKNIKNIWTEEAGEYYVMPPEQQTA